MKKLVILAFFVALLVLLRVVVVVAAVEGEEVAPDFELLLGVLSPSSMFIVING